MLSLKFLNLFSNFILFTGGLSEEIIDTIRAELGKIFPSKADINYMDVVEMVAIKMIIQLVAKIDPKQVAFWENNYDQKGNHIFL